MTLKLITLLCVAALSGCGACDPSSNCANPAPVPNVAQAPAAPPAPTRTVSLVRIQTYTDDLAYRGTRGVYVIQDSQTGKEFIGVSGVGIAEVGSHMTSAKSSALDER